MPTMAILTMARLDECPLEHAVDGDGLLRVDLVRVMAGVRVRVRVGVGVRVSWSAASRPG